MGSFVSYLGKSATSSIPHATIFTNSIREINRSGVIIAKDVISTGGMNTSLTFNEEIREKCQELLTRVKESNGMEKVTIDYYNNEILAITDCKNHTSYVSSKVSPTTFGYQLSG